MNTNTHTNKKVGQVSRPPHLENRVKCIGKILFTCLELGNNAKLCFTNELHDILNLRSIRHLVNNLVDSIEHACLSTVIGILNAKRITKKTKDVFHHTTISSTQWCILQKKVYTLFCRGV